MRRVMMINYGQQMQKCHVEIPGSTALIKFLKCDPHAASPDVLIATAVPPYDLAIDAGGVVGFVTNDAVTLPDLQSDLVIVIANGENPWPPPPSAVPSTFSSLAEFHRQYNAFALGD